MWKLALIAYVTVAVTIIDHGINSGMSTSPRINTTLISKASKYMSLQQLIKKLCMHY